MQALGRHLGAQAGQSVGYRKGTGAVSGRRLKAEQNVGVKWGCWPEQASKPRRKLILLPISIQSAFPPSEPPNMQEVASQAGGPREKPVWMGMPQGLVEFACPEAL